MKKLLSILSLCFLANTLYAQDDDMKKSCGKASGKKLFQCYTESNYYTVDRDNIVVSSILEDLGADKQELYNRLKVYFTRSDDKANWVMEQDNFEEGPIIVQGTYSTIGSHGYGVWNYKVYYTLRVDIVDNRARLVCTADRMIINNTVDNKVPERMCEFVDYIPLGKKKMTYNSADEQYNAFNTLVEYMNGTVHGLGDMLKRGSYMKAENSGW